MHLIRTAVIFGAGWVVGARAGRERYEQVAAAASLVAERPEVRRITEPVIAFFAGSDEGSAHRAPGQVQKAVATVRQQAAPVAGQVASKVSSVTAGSGRAEGRTCARRPPRPCSTPTCESGARRADFQSAAQPGRRPQIRGLLVRPYPRPANELPAATIWNNR